MTKKELRNIIREVVEQEVDEIIEERVKHVVYEMLFGRNSYLSEVIEKTLHTQGQYLIEMVSQTMHESSGEYSASIRPKFNPRPSRSARIAKDVVPSHLRETVISAPVQKRNFEKPIRESKISESHHKKITKEQLNLDDPGIDENILMSIMNGQLVR